MRRRRLWIVCAACFLGSYLTLTLTALASARERGAPLALNAASGRAPPWAPAPAPPGVAAAAARATALCSAPDASWVPTRVSRGLVERFPPIAVYHNVLLGGCCAHVTTGGGPRDGAACEGRTWDATDAGAVVWTTHFSRPREAGLAELAHRWGGCMSIAVSVCDREEWARVEAEWTRDPLVRSYVTLHVLVSNSTAYAFNAARNVAMEPFAAFGTAARDVWGAPQRSPSWLLVTDFDSLPSAPELTLRKVLRTAATPGSVLFGDSSGGSNGSVSQRSAADAEACTAHSAERLPAPHDCARSTGGMAAWAASEATTAAVLFRGRCPTPAYDLSRTLFAVTSLDATEAGEFDMPWRHHKISINAARAALRLLGPRLGDAAVAGHLSEAGAMDVATAAHARLVCAFDVSAVLQMRHWLKAYGAHLHWPAWLTPRSGFLPSHFAQHSEPYFVVRAAHAPRFDEAFRGPVNDKMSLYTPLLGGSSGARDWDLVHLPTFFLLQVKWPLEWPGGVPGGVMPAPPIKRYEPWSNAISADLLSRYNAYTQVRGDCNDGCWCGFDAEYPPGALRHAFRLEHLEQCDGWPTPPPPSNETMARSNTPSLHLVLHVDPACGNASAVPDVDVSGKLASLRATDAAACCAACVVEAQCGAWVWRGGDCWLKGLGEVASARPANSGLVAGRVREAG